MLRWRHWGGMCDRCKVSPPVLEGNDYDERTLYCLACARAHLAEERDLARDIRAMDTEMGLSSSAFADEVDAENARLEELLTGTQANGASDGVRIPVQNSSSV